MSTLPPALRRCAFLGCVASAALTVGAADPIDLYFLHATQTVREQGEAVVAMEVANYPLAEVVVSFRIVEAESTATRRVPDENGDLSDGDYSIEADDDPDDDNNYLFDPATGEGSFSWLGFPTRRFLSVNIAPDDLAEGEEQIVIEFDTAALEGLNVVAPARHTIFIQDDDQPDGDSPYPAHAYFDLDYVEGPEGRSLSIPVKLLSTSPQTRRLHWTEVYTDGEGQANAADIERDTTDTTPNSVDIAANVSQVNIPLSFAADLLVEGDETLQIQLSRMEYIDSDGNVATLPDVGDPTRPVDLTVDPNPITVAIIDDDPTTVQMDFSNFFTDFQEGVTLTEGQTSQFDIRFTLSAPLPEKVEIPITYSGNATRGDADSTAETNWDWRPNPDANDDGEDIISILADGSSATLQIFINNDITEESGDETITITMGTPQMVETTTNSAGETVEVRTDLAVGTDEGFRSTYTITIEDDDPVDLGFGKRNPDLDLEDPPEDAPAFIHDDEIILSEGAESASIPLYASGVPAANGQFEIQVVSEGTTAKMRDFSNADEEDWDFYIIVNGSRSQIAIETIDEPTEAFFFANTAQQPLTIVLNNDEEPVLPFRHFEAWSQGNTIADEGDQAYSQIEQEETVRLRLVQITNAEESGLVLRDGTTPTDDQDAREITIRIRDIPEIDLTAEFDGILPLEDNFVAGNPPRHPRTRLHELQFALTPKASLVTALEQFRANGSLDGYTAYKLAFQPSVYDVENPDDANNDLLRPRRLSGNLITEWEPDGFTAYFRLAVPTFTPRFPVGLDVAELLAGVEQAPNTPAFNEENAPIVALQPYFLRPLNLDVLDPDTSATREDFAALDEPMNYLIEFSNSGRTTFGADERARRLADTQILLTRIADPTNPGTGASFSGEIVGFEEQANGSILLELYNPNNSALNIEYMDAEGDEAGIWKPVLPTTVFQTGTNFFWIDQGPPKTEVHPREVNFRLYRISN